MKAPPIVLMLALLAMWLLLQGSVTPPQIALGLVLSVGATVAFRATRPVQPTLKKPSVALRLLGRVLLDILRSNLAVASIILGLVRDREVRSGFLHIPLDLRDPHGLAVLAAIVTSTPGTVWADLSRDGSTLTLHVLDLQNEEKWIRTIKGRYEQALREIFE